MKTKPLLTHVRAASAALAAARRRRKFREAAKKITAIVGAVVLVIGVRCLFIHGREAPTSERGHVFANDGHTRGDRVGLVTRRL